MSPKILFVIHKLGYGGAEKIMAFLANRLSDDGFQVSLLTYESSAVMQKLAPQVRHLTLNASSPGIYALRRLFQIARIGKVIRREQPDVVISFLAYPNIISIIASRAARIPVIISERGDPWAAKSWFTNFRDCVYNFADGYVFQTAAARNYFNKRIQSKAAVIPNPVTLENDSHKPPPNRENIVAHVGRFDIRQKRQDILLQAFACVAHRHPQTKLVFFGDGDDREKIVEMTRSCGLENRVVFAGVVRNIYEAIGNARLFVLSSDYEGLPNALIEAMSVGLPCIATDCSPGGVAELIRDHHNGLLVRPGSVGELAEAIDAMLADPPAAERMGTMAAQIKNDLAPNRITDLWKQYIYAVISPGSSRE